MPRFLFHLHECSTNTHVTTLSVTLRTKRSRVSGCAYFVPMGVEVRGRGAV
jgi:hypothetical protein